MSAKIMGAMAFGFLAFLLCAPALGAGAADEPPIVDPNLVGWWNFEEGGGAVALDSSGYGHHGTLMGDPQWAPGYDGLALDLDGQGDYIETGKMLSELGIGGDAPRTVALWVYPRSFNGGGLYEMGGHVSAGDGFCLRTQTNDNGWRLVYGTWEFGFVTDSMDEWVHITHANDFHYAEVYVDGEQVLDKWRRLDTPDDLTLRIGICKDLSFDGLIDDVRLYNRVVEQHEIPRIMGGAVSRAWGPYPAYGSYPTVDLAHSLRWSAGTGAAQHDIYLGTDRTAVDNATTGTEDIYQSRQPREATTFRLPEGTVQCGTTYYWRIDEIDGVGVVSKGGIWTFTVAGALTGWWKFDEGAGDVALDSSGHNHHGMLIGDPQWAPGYDALALDFDGLEDSVEIGKLPAEMGIDVNAPWSVALWVFARSFDGGGVFEMSGDGEFDHLSLRTGGLGDEWLVRNGPDMQTFTADSLNEWVHVGCVREPYWTEVTVNGWQVQTDYSRLDSVDETPFRVGVVDDHHFDGLVDDVRLYSRAVTQDEMVQIMQGDPARAWDPQPGYGSALTLDETGTLRWSAGTEAVAHDVYFGTDQAAVRDATSETEGIHRGRQLLEATTYVPPEAPLEWNTTYYWRIDEVGDAGVVTKGPIWRFTTLDYLIIDDFESYDDIDSPIYETWIDGWDNGTGSTVGYLECPFAEILIAHSGRQSMPFSYDNTVSPWYSEAYRVWDEPQDWTRFVVDTLRLYLTGPHVGSNDPGRVYVAAADEAGNLAAVNHPDPLAVGAAVWERWDIPLSEFAAGGVDLTGITQMLVGVGDRDNPTPGGEGMIHFDDFRLTRADAAAEPNAVP
ncbi:MAG: hypothetical protein JSW27_09950 [Phycisphaerales bacterium]|nr:MAG: hypothetical protein JSW27_09950 [Phycisphaerales bacterium]